MFDGIAVKQLAKELEFAKSNGREVLLTAYFMPEISKWVLEVEVKNKEKELTLRKCFVDLKRGDRKLYSSFDTLANELLSIGVNELSVKLGRKVD